jgi:hypothetical protein
MYNKSRINTFIIKIVQNIDDTMDIEKNGNNMFSIEDMRIYFSKELNCFIEIYFLNL